jgi:tetratricopeptide (TPR) repeat protein
MGDLRGYSRFCSLLTSSTLLCVLTSIAETNDPPTANSSHPRPVAVSPELQGDVLMARGKYAAALKSYEHETNQSAVLLNKIGLAYHHLLAFDQARKYYQQALAINPDFALALNNLAAVYFDDGDFAQAERMYRHALESQPGRAVILANLGAAYFADHKYKLGTEAYQQAVALDPNVLHPDTRQTVVEGTSTRQQAAAKDYSLAKVCAAAGKTSQAIDYLRNALENGFHDRKKLMKDDHFAALRSIPEFQQLMMEGGTGK